jgi:hypothetical protein
MPYTNSNSWIDNKTGDPQDANKFYAGDPVPNNPNVPYQPWVPDTYDPNQWLKQPYVPEPERLTLEKIQKMADALKKHPDYIGSERYLTLRKLIAKKLDAPINGKQVHMFMQLFYGKHEALPIDAKPKPVPPEAAWKATYGKVSSKLMFTGEIGRMDGVTVVGLDPAEDK